VAFDGGWSMGSNLPLLSRGESVEADGSQVRTSTGGVVVIPKKKATFGSLSSGGLY